MTLESEIKRYIKNYFHPYFDITLKPDSIPLTEPINCIIPTNFREQEKTIYTTFTHNQPENTEDFDTIIDKYDDTDIEKEYECFCTDITDGDTIKVKVINNLSDNNITFNDSEKITVRFVGVNTPEKGTNGYVASSKFTEKLCKNRTIYLNIDKKTPIDKYGRILAVVIVDNKNLNQILLKEKLAEIMYIPPSEFYPFDWDISAHISSVNTQNLNLAKVLPYLNNEFNNITFTNQDDYDVIHRFEMYKGIIYLKLYPYNSQIRLHILPKSYKGNSNLLIFKDELITNNNITKVNCSTQTLPPINASFSGNGNNTSYEMNYDISNATKGFSTLQINVGYRYPKSITKVFHLTGVKDNTNEIIADRCTLLDANYDYYSLPVNNITQFLVSSNTIIAPSINNLNIQEDSKVEEYNHLNKDFIFHKTIKYMNDDLYIQEESNNTRINFKYNWGE